MNMSMISCTAALLLIFLMPSAVFAQDDYLSLEEKARRSHELAMSDVIYEQENFKALYYQNQQIIELLREIRDEMHSLNVREAKDTKPAS
jgi:hypothetical protein